MDFLFRESPVDVEVRAEIDEALADGLNAAGTLTDHRRSEAKGGKS